jgi:nucleotide-binding universal stress UspA family protein
MMPSPRTHRFQLILVAVDFSPQSARALRYGVATARAAGGRVVALPAIDPLLSAAAARAYAERTLIADTRAALTRFVSKTVGREGAAHIECRVGTGAVRHVLIENARRLRADVIVVGTNARGGVPKLFFGSTTESLLRRSTTAVMVVPPRAPSPGPRWPDGRIVAAISVGPHRRAIVSAAARAAEVFGAWLTLAPADRPLPAARDGEPLIVLPLPAATRLRAFAQGGTAYEFVRRACVPVLVLHTGRSVGHLTACRAA